MDKLMSLGKGIKGVICIIGVIAIGLEVVNEFKAGIEDSES